MALPSGHLPASALSATPGRGRYVTQAGSSRDAVTPPHRRLFRIRQSERPVINGMNTLTRASSCLRNVFSCVSFFSRIMAEGDIAIWFKGIPIVTRVWFSLCVLFPLAGRIGLLNPLYMILEYGLVVYRFQVRLLLNPKN